MLPCFQRGQAQINFGSDSHHIHHLRRNHHHHHHHLLESNGHWPSKEQQGSSKKLVVHQHTIIYNCHRTIASYIIPPHHIIIIPYRTMPYHHTIIPAYHHSTIIQAPPYHIIPSYFHNPQTIIYHCCINKNTLLQYHNTNIHTMITLQSQSAHEPLLPNQNTKTLLNQVTLTDSTVEGK